MSTTPDPEDLYDITELPDPFPQAINWRTLSADQTSEELARLSAWVDWLTTRYTLTEIPPCWTEHGALIEELSALHGAWLVAFAPDASAAGSADWHAIFASTLPRITGWSQRRGCTARAHSPDPLP